MNTEYGTARKPGTLLGHPSRCPQGRAKSRPSNPGRKQTSVRGDAARDIGLPLYEILAVTDQMREAYGTGNWESLGNRLSLLMTKSALFASALSTLIERPELDATDKAGSCEEFDLAALLRETIQSTRMIIGDKPVKIMDVASHLPFIVHADRNRVSLIMTGLLNNAAKFTHRGRITVIITKDEDLLRITIADTGIGMTEHQISAYLPLAPSAVNSESKGTVPSAGRGLRAIRGLVSLLGGSMNLSSKPGEGTIVEVLLPFRQPEDLAGPASRGFP